MSMTPSDSIALGSVAVALTALGATLWQGWMTRRHNRLSVRPLLNLHRGRGTDLQFDLENHGLGPAIIQEFSVLAGGKAFVDPQQDPYPEVFKALNLVDLNYEFHLPVKGDAYMPSTSRTLLKIEFLDGKEDPERNQPVVAALSFRIRYASIYEEESSPLSGNGG